MKIAAFSVDMESSRQFSQRVETSERFETWGGGAARPDDGRARVRISDAARLAQMRDGASDTSRAQAEGAVDDAVSDDPGLSMLIRMIESFTGRPVRLFDARTLNAPDAQDSATETAAGQQTAPQRAGGGFEYAASVSRSESETTSFGASGVVRTADGQEIRFELGFTLSRSYSESASVTLRGGEPQVKDPLVLDFGGPAAALSDVRFQFDLDADGREETLPLPGGSGFLAFDRNGNGKIDNGSELFGPASGDGFAELAALDDDANGWIDESDAAWSQLRLWQPAAQGEGAVQTLKAAGVGAFYLGTVETEFSLRDANNEAQGQVRASSIYLREDGSAGTVSQVDLAV